MTCAPTQDDISACERALCGAAELLGSRVAAVEALFALRAGRHLGRGESLAGMLLGPALDAPGAAIAAAHETGEQAGGRSRRARGAFYTPVALADHLVERALSEFAPGPVLDPACGTGNFLLAVARALRHRGLRWPEILPRLHGIDLDPAAVAIARGLLAEAAHADTLEDTTGWSAAEHQAVIDGLRERIVCGDALEDGVLAPDARFDLIIGNPPFGNAIEKETARTDAERVDYAQRFPIAASGAYDKAGLFVERALQLASPRARIGLVLPRAMLAATYAAGLRAHVDAHHQLRELVVTDAADHFRAAAVYVSGVVIGLDPAPAASHDVRVGEARRRLPADSRWGVLLSPYAELVGAIPNDWPRLDALATIVAGASTGEAYEFVAGVSEEWSEGAWKLITTGSIDPFVCHWGRRTTRYLKRDYLTPWLARSVVSPRRAALYDRPKVMVAGLSPLLEAVLDTDGSCAGAVASLALTVEGDDLTQLTRLCAYLNSALARRQFLALHGAQALGGGSVQVSKTKLGDLRVPPGSLGDESDFDEHLEAVGVAADRAVVGGRERC